MSHHLREKDPLLTTPLGPAVKPPPPQPPQPLPPHMRPQGLYKGPDGKWSYKPFGV